MLCKRIIPCLDVKDGRVVKGRQFVGLRDAGDPVEQAERYNAEGADEICFLDIAGSLEKRGLLLDMICRTGEKVFVPLTVGGGVSSVDDFRDLLKAGADKIAVNSAALARPTLIQEAAERFGSQCVVLAVDAKRDASAKNGWRVYSHGGRTPTERDALEWIEEAQRLGVGEVLLTSIDRDGTRQGYDLELTAAVTKRLHIPLIASGGVGTLEHLAEGLQQGGADAVLAASIFHEKNFTIGEVKKFLAGRGILVRI